MKGGVSGMGPRRQKAGKNGGRDPIRSRPPRRYAGLCAGAHHDKDQSYFSRMKLRHYRTPTKLPIQIDRCSKGVGHSCPTQSPPESEWAWRSFRVVWVAHAAPFYVETSGAVRILARALSQTGMSHGDRHIAGCESLLLKAGISFLLLVYCEDQKSWRSLSSSGITSSGFRTRRSAGGRWDCWGDCGPHCCCGGCCCHCCGGGAPHCGWGGCHPP